MIPLSFRASGPRALVRCREITYLNFAWARHEFLMPSLERDACNLFRGRVRAILFSLLYTSSNKFWNFKTHCEAIKSSLYLSRIACRTLSFGNCGNCRQNSCAPAKQHLWPFRNQTSSDVGRARHPQRYRRYRFMQSWGSGPCVVPTSK